MRFLDILIITSCALALNTNQKSIKSSLKLKTSPSVYTLFPTSQTAQDNLFLTAIDTLFINPTKFVLNTVGDLLRISGPAADFPPAFTMAKLLDEISIVQPNGLIATQKQRQSITSLVEVLEQTNPTPKPARSTKMSGMWKLLYTDFSPAAPSSGKLGPFVGDVYQDLRPAEGLIKNILKIKYPPIDGCLSASQRVVSDSTWEIEFKSLYNTIFGIPIVNKPFPTKEVREWRVTYLDSRLRIMRAKRPEATESFIFVLQRR